MNLSDLLEDGNKDLVIIYPGRFHPFHIGHGKVYQYLKQNYSNAKVFISTSGKVDGDRSPFTFEEKRKMMILAGVDSGAIVQTKSPYQSIEIMERFDKDKTVVVFAVSEKDMAEDPRFDFSNGLKLKKNGEPAYLQKWNSLDDAETFGTRGYIATTPTFKFKVLGQEINSASQIRNMIAKSDDTKLTQMLQDLYSVTDVPQDIIDLFKNKVGNKETMNENWDEHSFSKFLKENVIEDNIMKTGILKTITEGKSPHKKGTKKYNAHMAAMHAESIDEEFDRKVKEIVELKKTNEWVQKPHEGQKWTGQERNFIQELCLRMDGVSKSPEGLKWMGKSKTWDEGNVLSNKGKLTTVMLWAKRNIDDLYDRMGSEFKVYSDGNDEGDSGRGQSDGNQIIQNIIGKIGSVEEVAESKMSVAADIKDYVDDHKENFDAYPMDVEVDDKVYDWDEYWGILDKVYPDAYDNQYAVEGKEQLEEAFVLAPWILPMLATAIRGTAPALVLKGLSRLLKVGKSGAKKVKVPAINATTSVLKNPGISLSWLGGGYVFKSVYDVMEKTKEVVGDFLDDLSIEKFAEVVWKYKLPVAAVMAVLYGGKQLKDYMAGEEEEKGNTTINNYYNGDDEPVAEASVLAHGGKGQYKAVTDGGVVRIMHKGKEIASGDFDSGADGWFVSRDSDKGQKFFSNAQDMVDHFAENIHAKTNEEKEELKEFWPAVAYAASRIPASTYASAGTAIAGTASKAGKWIKSKLKSSVDPKLKEDYANEQHEQLEYIHHVLQECGDGNMDITMVEQAIEYVEDIREQHFNTDGSTKSESVNEEEVTVDNEGNIAGYLDTIDEYVLMLFKNKELPLAHKNEVAYRIQNAVDDIRTRELGLKPSNVRASYANESESDDFDEGVMGTIGQGIDNAVVGAGKLIKKGAKAAAPHVKKAAVKGAKKISKIGSKNTSYDMKTGKTNTTYGMANATEAYNEDDSSDLEKMQNSYKHNEDRNNHSENILMLAQAFGSRPEIKAVEGLLTIIRRQGYTTPEQSEMMYNAIHKKYYSQLFPAENEGNEFSGELAKAKIDGKKEFKVDGKTYKVKEALSKLIDSQKMTNEGILHYSDAKGTAKYSEGYKAAKDGAKYDENPYSGAEKLQWSKGHNDFRADELSSKGEPNYGARGQFESK